MAEARALVTQGQLSPEGVEQWNSINKRLQEFWGEIELIMPEYVATRHGTPIAFEALRDILRS